MLLNRIFNTVVRILFQISYNDCTNAFKLYKRETLDGLRPFMSPHFNLTLELPLKAIVRGYSYTVLPNSWHNRKSGSSKLKMKEMGSRYVFILLYCLIERYFSRGDFQKNKKSPLTGGGLRELGESRLRVTVPSSARRALRGGSD